MKNTIKELKNEIKKLHHLVATQGKELNRFSSLIDYDFLTGLYNRHGFIKEAEKFFEELKNMGKGKEKRKLSFKNFSIVFIDLDNLKIINDEYGHKTGDKALKMAAAVFKNSLRDLDLAARWGGDEFVIGLVGASEKESLKIAQKLRKKLKLLKVNSFNLSASFGIVSAVKKDKIIGATIFDLIEKADMMMYEAKKQGKDFIVAF